MPLLLFLLLLLQLLLVLLVFLLLYLFLLLLLLLFYHFLLPHVNNTKYSDDNDNKNNHDNSNSSNSQADAQRAIDQDKAYPNAIAKATKQERGETLGRISVRTAYDPWELLDVLTQANESTSSRLDFVQRAPPPYLSRPRCPLYDLIIIDCLHTVLAPYYNIAVPDAKTVNLTGSVGLLGTKRIFGKEEYRNYFFKATL